MARLNIKIVEMLVSHAVRAIGIVHLLVLARRSSGTPTIPVANGIGGSAWHGKPHAGAPNCQPTGLTSDAKQMREPTGSANTTPTACAAPTLAPNSTTPETTQTTDSKCSSGSVATATAPRHNAKHAQHKQPATPQHANATQSPTPASSNPTTTHPGGAPTTIHSGPTGLANADLRAEKSFFSSAESS